MPLQSFNLWVIHCFGFFAQYGLGYFLPFCFSLFCISSSIIFFVSALLLRSKPNKPGTL